MLYMHFFNIFPIYKYCQTVYKKSQKKGTFDRRILQRLRGKI